MNLEDYTIGHLVEQVTNDGKENDSTDVVSSYLCLVGLVNRINETKVLVLDRPFSDNPDIIACLFECDVKWVEFEGKKMVSYEGENYFYKTF